MAESNTLITVLTKQIDAHLKTIETLNKEITLLNEREKKSTNILKMSVDVTRMMKMKIDKLESVSRNEVSIELMNRIMPLLISQRQFGFKLTNISVMFTVGKTINGDPICAEVGLNSSDKFAIKIHIADNYVSSKKLAGFDHGSYATKGYGKVFDADLLSELKTLAEKLPAFFTKEKCENIKTNKSKKTEDDVLKFLKTLFTTSELMNGSSGAIKIDISDLMKELDDTMANKTDVSSEKKQGPHSEDCPCNH